MTDYNDGKWHGWNGGECPVHPESVVDVFFSDGITRNEETAGGWTWDYLSYPIVAFRVIKQHKEPREFWIGDGCFFDSIRQAKISGVTDAIHVREVTE